MTHPGTPKMSLVAQYDDLCRYEKVLTAGCEGEFRTFTESQLKCVRDWKEYKEELKQMEFKISRLENENRILETGLLESETTRRMKAESEKSSMERQIVLIKEVLLADHPIDNEIKEKLVLLSSTCQPVLKTIEESVGSILNFSDFDCTDDDLDNARHSAKTRRSRGKRSSSENKSSSKRRKSEDKKQSFHEEVVTDYAKFVDEATPYRSSSEPSEVSVSILPERIFVRQVHSSDLAEIKSNTYNTRNDDPRSIFGSTPLKRTNTSSKLSRTHLFCNKTVIRTEKCYACSRLIKFCKQALKCQDCRVTCHPECKDQCPMPCFPVASTPTKGEMGTIADYTSTTPPMLPSLIVHCVNEIETRGLKERGLYRLCGSEREVKDLKEKFLRGRSVPCLNQVDIHVICSTVKEFLRSLKEPLIPRLSWQTFVNAADISNVTQSLNVLYKAVCDLPQPNRDTLAFLVLHLQRVAETAETKMPVENLARIFGPTIVGYSSNNITDCNVVIETKNQSKVMQRLLLISKEHWCNWLNFEPDVSNINKKNSECLSAPPTSRLGSIYSTDTKPKSTLHSRMPLTPRNTKPGPHKGKRFFTSPLIKN
ncbi:rac GTPase-activating protein 1-like [Uloborus diversus]|uniref:rac GTPase-activating protein 1-like n=1 Tax=Uloborus diversus TaxID=327109 RepID=UPI002408FE64|nr:rac GTPase-activating protein 1-like [Uloborus diversus]